MADYQLTAGTSVIRTIDGAVIPNDPANLDYVEYLNWLALGNYPDPYVAPPTPPPVRDANARLDAGVLAALNIAIEVRDSIHAIPSGFTPAHFTTMMLQLKVLTDAFVAMLQGQANPE
jgi:hypothetical protein